MVVLGPRFVGSSRILVHIATRNVTTTGIIRQTQSQTHTELIRQTKHPIRRSPRWINCIEQDAKKLLVASQEHGSSHSHHDAGSRPYLQLFLLVTSAMATSLGLATVTLCESADHVRMMEQPNASLSHANAIEEDANANANDFVASSRNDPKYREGANSLLATSSSSEELLLFDFVIVGHGRAGMAAAATLRSQCPRATIAIVDPHHHANHTASLLSGNNNNKYTHHFYGTSAIGWDPSLQTVSAITPLSQPQETAADPSVNHEQEKEGTSGNGIDKGNADGRKIISYRHGILMATGSRGAPPPVELVDPRAWSRVLEVRATVPPSQPHMAPAAVRHVAELAASQGASIYILGNGLEALQLAAACRRQQHHQHGQSAYTTNKTNHKHSNNTPIVTMVFGSAGPLSTRLPRYLSRALSKRLQFLGMDLQERSLIRYVAMMAAEPSSSSTTAMSHLELHLVKSYDSLDTQRHRADLLIVAPSVEGQRGTGILPVIRHSKEERDVGIKDDSDGEVVLRHSSWANLTSSSSVPLVTCYADDGRIMVNAELSAASNVYAAGSVAKYPNPISGNPTVAGEGPINAAVAGQVAAHNMARQYHLTSSSSSLYSKQQRVPARTYANESISIWRTDVEESPVPSNNSSHDDNNDVTKPTMSHLNALGIHALCVGDCDSECMSTHGFWWTNQAMERHNKRRSTHTKNRSDNLQRKLTRRRTMVSSSETSDSGAGGTSEHSTRRSVYGAGVVYYLDRSGSIRGIMTWGLPFTSSPSSMKLNNKLVNRMKELIRTNGRAALDDIEESVFPDGDELDDLLTSQDLSEETKWLAALALGHGGKGVLETLAKPLHRYVPAKPTSVANMGLLKRTGGEASDQQLFIRPPANNDDGDVDSYMTRPPSLVYVYPMEWSNSHHDGFGGSSGPFGSSDEAEKEDAIRARPPREEPLWSRQGDSSRSISVKDTMRDVFLTHVRKGQFQDGSDSVQQAPTPKIVTQAREKMNSWRNGSQTPEQDNDELFDDEDHYDEE
eukprot:scaffold15518_cov50-Attheya_sp.AAC.4